MKSGSIFIIFLALYFGKTAKNNCEIPNCEICEENICESCSPAYEKTHTGVCILITQESKKTSLSESNFSNQIENCIIFNKDNTCKECKTDYKLKENNCNLIPNINRSLLLCTNNCKSCSNDKTKCLDCNKVFKLTDNECVKKQDFLPS